MELQDVPAGMIQVRPSALSVYCMGSWAMRARRLVSPYAKRRLSGTTPLF